MRWSIVALFTLAMYFLAVSCGHIAADYETHPYHYNPYSFGYDVEDNYGNKQWRQERSYDPQEVHGSYGYRDNQGIYREVTYVADKNGFRANIQTNEPGYAGTKDPAAVKVESHHLPAPVERAQVYTRYIPSPGGYNHNNLKV